jgi:hypothetical protein
MDNDKYAYACRVAATDQGLDPLTEAVSARRADLERVGATYAVEQTGGFTMVATFYIGVHAVTCTDEGSWIVVCQPKDVWLEGGDYADPRIEDWSGQVKTPTDIIDRVIAHVTRDAEAMDAITAILSGSEWSADTAPAIAEVVAATGRVIADFEGEE